MGIRIFVRSKIINVINYYIYNKIFGMDVDITCKISTKAFLDKTYPKGIHIGAFSLVARGCCILTHDFTRSIKTDTIIGRNCFLGVNTIVLPGVRIGDNSIVGAGSVVTKDIPANCIAVGNPCRVIRENVSVGKYGRLE